MSILQLQFIFLFFAISHICNSAIFKPKNSIELNQTLGRVNPGDIIELVDQIYEGEFIANRSGTKEKPILMKGSSNARLENRAKGKEINKFFGFWLKADHWILRGFT